MFCLLDKVADYINRLNRYYEPLVLGEYIYELFLDILSVLFFYGSLALFSPVLLPLWFCCFFAHFFLFLILMKKQILGLDKPGTSSLLMVTFVFFQSTGAFIAVTRYASATPMPPSVLSRGVGWQVKRRSPGIILAIL